MTPEHPSNPRELTNADRIRSMTDDELAEIISADMVEEKNRLLSKQEGVLRNPRQRRHHINRNA